MARVAAVESRASAPAGQSARSFVDKLDFLTSAGYLDGGDAREKLGIKGRGPTRVITDLCILEPEAGSRELVVTSIHPGITRAQITEATGWDIRFANDVIETAPPTETELGTLRAFLARTAEAHGTHQ